MILSHLYKNTIDNRYTKIYCKLIIQYKRRFGNKKEASSYFGYAEKHHIVPKCINKDLSKDVNNLVYVSAREHFLLHKLLTRMFQGQIKYKMYESLSVFSNNINRNIKLNSRDIESIRQSNAIAASHRNKGNQNYKQRDEYNPTTIQLKSENASRSKWVNNGSIESFTQNHTFYVSEQNYMYGRLPFSDKTKEAMTNALLGRGKGIPKTKEHIINISKAAKNRPKTICEFCGRLLTVSNHNRWHGKNCKLAIHQSNSSNTAPVFCNFNEIE